MTLRVTWVWMAVVALGLHAGCSSAPRVEHEDEGTSAQALTASCVLETGGYTGWLFDAKCNCPWFADTRDEQCAYEQGLVSCLSSLGVAFSCASPPRIPIVMRYDYGKASAEYEELSIAAYANGDCNLAGTLQKCIQSLNLTSDPYGRPYSGPPVAAAVFPNCFKDVCPGVGNDVWDPCTTKACYVE